MAGKGISFPQPAPAEPERATTTSVPTAAFTISCVISKSWSGQTLYYKGSVVSFYYSRQAIGVYKDGLTNTVYVPPIPRL